MPIGPISICDGLMARKPGDAPFAAVMRRRARRHRRRRLGAAGDEDRLRADEVGAGAWAQHRLPPFSAARWM
ncbi:hypothetical protein ACVOMV_29435 [Mesorhizobium atlanticum]